MTTLTTVQPYHSLALLMDYCQLFAGVWSFWHATSVVTVQEVHFTAHLQTCCDYWLIRCLSQFEVMRVCALIQWLLHFNLKLSSEPEGRQSCTILLPFWQSNLISDLKLSQTHENLKWVFALDRPQYSDKLALANAG